MWVRAAERASMLPHLLITVFLLNGVLQGPMETEAILSPLPSVANISEWCERLQGLLFCSSCFWCGGLIASYAVISSSGQGQETVGESISLHVKGGEL